MLGVRAKARQYRRGPILVLTLLRLQSGMTVLDFARTIGISRQSLQMLELGRSQPRRQTLDLLAKHFHVHDPRLLFDAVEISVPALTERANA